MMTLAVRPALLGRDIARIRKTNQTPPKVSVIDVVQTITGKDAKHAAGDVRNLCSSYPEVDGIFVHFRFPGRGTVQIRKTNETPPRISIIDVAIAVTGKTHHDAAQDYRRLLNQYPEVGTNWFHLKFPGRGQRDTGKGFEFSGPREIK